MKHFSVLGIVVLLAVGVRGQRGVQGAFGTGGRVPGQVISARPSCSRHASSGGVRLELTGVYIDSSLLWFVFRGTNGSAIDFRAGGMRFAFKERRALKRRALQELRLVPVVRLEAPVVRSDSAVRLYYGLVPRVPSTRQELVIEWVERNGDRRMQLHVPARILLTARRL
ncbi:MAG TPA: DUF4138 domain-containing protein [Puia sp.]|nr:DUF4138 domain-containing protein [Puia sp.]